jgi:capsular polysaccharide biosynthesis protein
VALAAGAIAALAILFAGGMLIRSQPEGWSADATLVVTPASSLGNTAAAAYYETLSHGQIVSTYAEVLRLSDLESRVERAISVPAADRDATSVSIHVVPETSLIIVRSSAPSKDLAERFAAAAAQSGAADLVALKQPFTVATLRSAETRATENDRNTLAIALVAVVLAAIAALLVARAVVQVQLLLAARQIEQLREQVAAHEAEALPTQSAWR